MMDKFKLLQRMNLKQKKGHRMKKTNRMAVIVPSQLSQRKVKMIMLN